MLGELEPKPQREGKVRGPWVLVDNHASSLTQTALWWGRLITIRASEGNAIHTTPQKARRAPAQLTPGAESRVSLVLLDLFTQQLQLTIVPGPRPEEKRNRTTPQAVAVLGMVHGTQSSKPSGRSNVVSFVTVCQKYTCAIPSPVPHNARMRLTTTTTGRFCAQLRS